MNLTEELASLTAQIPCPRCQRQVAAMRVAMRTGQLVSEGAMELAQRQILVTACAAAGHPA